MKQTRTLRQLTTLCMALTFAFVSLNNYCFAQIGVGFGTRPTEKVVKSKAPAVPQKLNQAAAALEPAVARMTIKNKSNDRIEKELGRKKKADFNNMPLRKVLEALAIAPKTTIQIIIDEASLKEEMINPDEPITFKAKNMTLANRLKHILGPLGLTYHVSHDSLVVTTQTKENETMVCVCYNVKKLIAAGISPNPLMNTIKSSTSGSWEEGVGGSISYLPGCLVVKQTYQVHKEIMALLKELETVVKSTNVKRVKSTTDVEIRTVE